MLKGTKCEILHLVGEGMRLRRLSLNLSQNEAAARSGLSISTVKNLEYGRGATLWALVTLCRTYGHDKWVLELAPEESLATQMALADSTMRRRATKRKAVRHV